MCVHKPVYLEGAAAAAAAGGGNSNMTSEVNSSSAHQQQRQRQQDMYLTFSRNLILQTPRCKGSLDMEEIWDEEAESMFGSMDKIIEKDKSSLRKRKADVMEEDGDDKKTGEQEDDGDPLELGKREEMLPLCGLEDDECMLSYLQSTHKGDFERAKLSTLIHVDRGYGTWKRIL